MRKPTLQIRPNGAKSSETHPWVIQGLRVDGKRKRLFFKTKAAAETELGKLSTRIKNEGVRALTIPEHLRVMAVEWNNKLAPYGKTIADAADFYIKYLEQTKKSCTFAELKDSVIGDKTRDGKSRRYIEDLRSRLGRFAQYFGDTNVATITTAQLNDWLRGLTVGPKSRNNFRRVLHGSFAYAVDHGYCAANPVARAAKAKDVHKAPEIFTPAQARLLLESAGTEILPAIAIGMFAGLRDAEIQRLDWSEVNLERKFIDVKAGKSKTAQRRLVTIEPTLALWLAPYAAHTSGKVIPKNFRTKSDEAWEATKLETKWPGNGLRHSYASYHLAHFNDAARLALQLGHGSTKMLFANYREVVQPSEAKEFWEIVPKPKDDQQPENVIPITAAA